MAEHRAGLLCVPLWQKVLSQRMQSRFELLAVGFTQRSRLGIIDDAVQLFHIYVQPPAPWEFPFHNWLSKSRNFELSG